MELLFATPAFASSRHTSFMTITATELRKRGHDVRGVQYKAGEAVDTIPIDRRPIPTLRTPYWVGQWRGYRHWKRRITGYLDARNPDVLVADRMAMAPTIEAGTEAGVPVVGVVPGMGFTRFAPRNLRRDKTPTLRTLPWSARIQYPFVRSLFRQHRRALDKATEVVVISEFLRETIKATFDRKSTIVRTPVPLDAVTADSHDQRYLTLVNPRTELKGAGIFLEMAEELDHEFLIVGEFSSARTGDRVRSLANVTHLGWIDDMRRVYADTAIVIVPSLVEEGGGPRVVLEGFANGIPAVGTNRGAIPEHIGDAGKIIDDPHDIDRWGDAINEVLETRETMSERARERAQLFDVDRVIDRLERILEGCLE